MTDRELLEAIYEAVRPKEKKKVSVARNGVTEPLQSLVEPYRGSTPPRELEKFLSYWTETNSKGTERWLNEKTWNTEKRLKRWMMNVEERQQAFEHRQQVKQTVEIPRETRTNFTYDEEFSPLIE